MGWDDTSGNGKEAMVDEYILSKPGASDCSPGSDCGANEGDRCLTDDKGDAFCEDTQSAIGGESGLIVVDDTSNGFQRTVRLQRPREENGIFEFSANNNVNEIKMDMISASAGYYEYDLRYHGSNRASQKITLQRKSGCCSDENCNGNKVCGAQGVCENPNDGASSGGCSSNSDCAKGNKKVCQLATGQCVKCTADTDCNANRKCEDEQCVAELEMRLFSEPALAGEQRVAVSMSDALLGTALLVAAAFLVEQLWKRCRNDEQQWKELRAAKNRDVTPLLV